MTIDLRYFLPFVAFYVPGAMLAFGAWLLGYQWHEARDFVAFAGLFFGLFCAAMTAAFIRDVNPLLVRIGRKGGWQ
jgi:hypothetical protein